MSNKPKLYSATLLCLALLLASVLSACKSTPIQPPSTNENLPQNQPVEAKVVRVVDGDTIEVDIGGSLYKVRYIGMDTPETVHPTKPVEYFGKEASEKNRELVEGKTVLLEKDISEVDKYGRLLRYVWVDDVMINAELVRLGYAQVATYPPDVKYQEYFLQLQKEAEEASLGLWAEPLSTASSTSNVTEADNLSDNATITITWTTVGLPDE